MSTHDYGPIVIHEYTAVWRPVPYVSGFLGGRVLYTPKWVVTTDGAFVGLADSPEEVQRLVRFVRQLPKAA
jgi:hypothetical protein